MNKTVMHYNDSKKLTDIDNIVGLVSRMYYAVLHCMCDTLLICYGVDVGKNANHKFVRGLFVEKTKCHGLENEIKHWQSCRENADYQRNVDKQKSVDELLSCVNRMSVFIQQQQALQESHKQPRQ